MEQSMFEQMGGEYKRVGDYYLPELALPDDEDKPIGIWGQRHLRYIRQNKKALYLELKATAKLNAYLADIDAEAKNLFSRLVKELAEKEGVTEALKTSDQMEWVARMNNIRERASEIVNSEMIYT